MKTTTYQKKTATQQQVENEKLISECRALALESLAKLQQKQRQTTAEILLKRFTRKSG